MDSVNRINIFIQVVKHGSFIGAARALGLTGPAISKQVQSLEKRLGIKLLKRTTRHVSLTEEGAVYFDRTRKALADLEEAEKYIQELKACPTGKLKVNVPTSFGTQFLTKPIAAFAQQYPDVELEVDFNDRWVDILEEGYDVVVRIASLEDSSLVARKLAPCPLVLCVSANLVKEKGWPETVSELSDYPAVIYNQHNQKEVWRYKDEKGEVRDQTLNRVFASNTAEMQLEACLQGIGVALLPIYAAHACLQSGELVEVFPEHKTFPERGIYAIYPQNRYLSTRTRLFIDALTDASKQFAWC